MATKIGTSGDDTLEGTRYQDRLEGKEGDDTLKGGGHVDTLIGGPGNDTLSGGTAGDTFVFGPGAASGESRHKTITDWNDGDRIVIPDDASWIKAEGRPGDLGVRINVYTPNGLPFTIDITNVSKIAPDAIVRNNTLALQDVAPIAPAPAPAIVQPGLVASAVAASTDGMKASTPPIDTTGADLIVLSVTLHPWHACNILDNLGNTNFVPIAEQIAKHQERDIKTLLYRSISPNVGTGHVITVYSGPNSFPSVLVAGFRTN